MLHAGIRTTLAEVREEFWIIRGRQQVKKHLSHCVACRKQTSRHFDESPAMLPLDRIREAEPFEIMGVDYAGPLLCLGGLLTRARKKEAEKRWAEQRKEKEEITYEESPYASFYLCSNKSSTHRVSAGSNSSHFCFGIAEFIRGSPTELCDLQRQRKYILQSQQVSVTPAT